MPDRDFDLVLFGATGFTGALVAAHLAAHAPPTLRWALAGRSSERVRAVRDQLAKAHPHAADLPIVVADSADERSLDALAARTRVVLTTVGPYLKYGLPLVGACARAGTHYADLTGEVPFMRRSIDAFDAIARGTGARIVHACGYDSIPSDLGTLMVQEAMVADGAPAQRVRTVVGPSSGGVSGGTLASMMEILVLAEDRDARRAMAHPYALDPADDRGTADRWDDVRVRFDDHVQRWVAPFFMAPVNTRVVRRSHALLGRPWGADFSYTEVMATGPGASGWATAWGITLALGAFIGAASQPTLRGLMARHLLPKPGEGPSEQAREAGFFRHLVVGVGADPSHRRIGRVIGTKDPGYGGTAIMIGQAALALATADLPDRAGVLTAATGIGTALLDPLRAHGMTWAVEPWPDGAPPRP